MENTQSLDSNTALNPVSEEMDFNAQFANAKMIMLTERLKAAYEMLGTSAPPNKVPAKNGSTDDILPFTALKKGAKLLRGTKYHHLYELHTNEYWNKQMNEIDGLALAQVLGTASPNLNESQSSEAVS